MVDIPYHVSESDDDSDRADVDSLHYVDAGTVNIASSTSGTARYWGDSRHQVSAAAAHNSAAAATSVSVVRTTAVISLSSALLLLQAVSPQLV